MGCVCGFRLNSIDMLCDRNSKILIILIALLTVIGINAQNSHDSELNRLWNQVEFWEKTGNIDRTIEIKEKLVDLYRNYYPIELPLMLRNMAITYDSLPHPYCQKSKRLFEEAMRIICQREKNDSNYTLYYNCLIDMIGGDFSRKNYGSILADINDHIAYLTVSEFSHHKEEISYIKKLKYNTIGLYNDSCQTLCSKDECNSAYNIMSSYVPEFIQTMRNDSLYNDLDNDEFRICLLTVWQYAGIIEKIKDINYSIELRELHNRFLRLNLDHSLNDISLWNYLWVMERTLAIIYRKAGNHAMDIELSKRIVNEARQFAPELLPSKLFDLGISYDDATENGRLMAQAAYQEALDIIDYQSNFEDVETKLRVIDQLLAQYVLNVQYDKALAVFDKYDSFLNECLPKYESLLMDILSWKTSVFHYLNYSITNSRDEAKEINERLLDYSFRNYGENSLRYLVQLRQNAISGTFNDIEIDSLYSKGYFVWRKMDKGENIAEYTSFLISYYNFQLLHGKEIAKSLVTEIDSLINHPQIDFHTQINYYYNCSVFEYNNWNYSKSLEYIKKAEVICENHKDASEIKERLAEVLIQKAFVALCLGDMSMNKESAYKAYNLAEGFKFDNLNVANLYSSLSYVFENFGDVKTALELSAKSFNVRYKCEGNFIQLDAVNETLRLFGPFEQLKLIDTLHIENFMSNPQVVPILLTKAKAHINLNSFNEADSCLRIAELCFAEHKGNDIFKDDKAYNMTKADIAYCRGLICYYENRPSDAIEYFKIYKDINCKDNGQPVLWLNSMYAIVQDSVNFCKETQITYDYIKNEIRNHFIFLSDHEREIYMRDKIATAINELESYAYLYTKNPQARLFAYNAVLLEKGLALSSASKISDLMKKSQIDNNYMLVLKQQFDLAKSQEQRSSIQMKMDLEEQRLQKAIDISSIMTDIMIDVKTIKESLKPLDVVVEFIKYVSITDNRSDYPDYHIGALVLTSDSEFPYFVDLCSIEKLREIKLKGKNIYSTPEDLFNLIWAPIQKYIMNHTNVFFSPVDLLYSMNIEYVAEAMSNNISFIRISSSRELVYRTKSKDDIKNTTIFGGLCYDCYTKGTTKEDYHSNYLNTIDNDTITRGSLAYLPGSLEEVTHISDCLSKAKVRVTLYSNNQGTEVVFKNLSGMDVSVLHMSTHGFSYGRNSVKDYDEPMRKCGLLLSGCQNAWNGENCYDEEDGILLGEEIANIQLKNNQLVVLSACETGLGVATPEGVWGLQRAFKKAGAGSILMSLWKVSDVATEMLMTEFYNNICEGKGKRESLRLAQKKVREYKNSDGSFIFQDPHYWAGFVMLD